MELNLCSLQASITCTRKTLRSISKRDQIVIKIHKVKALIITELPLWGRKTTPGSTRHYFKLWTFKYTVSTPCLYTLRGTHLHSKFSQIGLFGLKKCKSEISDVSTNKNNGLMLFYLVLLYGLMKAFYTSAETCRIILYNGITKA
jgi:hypothetical protein